VTLSPENLERFGSDPRERFAANLALVHRRIAAACEHVGRPIDSVRLLPITKTVPAEILRLAWAAGVTDFGENKLQEARDKAEAVTDLSLRWHVVGHLQSNKVKYLTRLADEFHALDSLKLAEVLNKRLETDGRDMNVYVQVNTSGEESKFGLHPDDALDFIERLEAFPRLKPQGLMTLAIFSDDAERVRPCFTLLRSLRDKAERIDRAHHRPVDGHDRRLRTGRARRRDRGARRPGHLRPAPDAERPLLARPGVISQA